MRKIERLGLVLLEGSLGDAVRSCAGPYLRSEMRDSGAHDGSFCSFFNCIGGVKGWVWESWMENPPRSSRTPFAGSWIWH
jgi:hypothetical protein